MAHELSFTNGTADFFEVGTRTAWHREGHLLVAHPNFQEALEVANLDYTVEKRKVFLSAGEGDYRESEKAMVTVRTDTGLELGSVGPDYKVVQNRDAFAVIRPLIDEGFGRLECGGALRNGADAWLLMQWNLDRFGPVVKEVFASEVVPFGLIAANHSGRRGILLQNTPIRVVCANTLGASEEGQFASVSVRHSGDAEQKLVEAAHTLWGGIIERYEVLARHYRTLKARTLTPEEFNRFVIDTLADDPRKSPRFNPEAKLAEMVVARYESKVRILTKLWYEGKGHTGDQSAWEAYNAAVEGIDHNVGGLFPTRDGTYRTASLLTGTLAQKKTSVLNRLLRASGGEEVSLAV